MKRTILFSPASRFLRILPLSLILAAWVLPGVLEAGLFTRSWPKIFKESNGLEAEQMDPDSGAEILIRWVEIDDTAPEETEYSYFYRVKVFNDRGVSANKLIELEGGVEGRLRRVQARVTHPDGRTEEIEKNAITKKEKFKIGRMKEEAVAFASPNLEPGCVIDYRWEALVDGSAYGYRLKTRRNLPTHHLKFRMRFNRKMQSAWTWSKMDGKEFEKARTGGYHEVNLYELEALPDEDFLPPPTEIQPWLTVYYTFTTGKKWIQDFWEYYAEDMADDFDSDVRARNREVKKLAAQLTANVADNDEKLRKIYDFCQKGIADVYDPAEGYTSEEQKKMMKKINDGADVLENGYGSYYYINMLFASLAKAAGFEVEIANVSSKIQCEWKANMAYWGSLPYRVVGARPKGDERWTFYCPGDRRLSFGMLPYFNEGAGGILGITKGDPQFFKTAGSPASKNLYEQSGEFALDAYGTLSGRVRLSYNGQFGYVYRLILEDMTAEERKEYYEEDLEESLTEFKLDGLVVEGMTDTAVPLTVSFDLEIEGYGDRTSTRLFFEPAVFRKGVGRRFSEKEREFDVAFPFRWVEVDKVRISVPENYRLEQASAPQGVCDFDALRHKISIRASKKTGKIYYDRLLQVNVPGFPIKAYDEVREIFGQIDEQDHHLLTLQKQEVEETADETAVESVPVQEAADTAAAEPVT